jgi:hypothetical protein
MSKVSLRVMEASLVFTMLSCSPDRNTGPTVPSDSRPSLSITASCSNSATAVGGFIKNWTCGSVVRLATPAGMTSTEVSALSSAASRWNSGVLNGYGLPRFDMSSGNQTITVSISGTGDYYCGQVPDKYHLNIARSDLGNITPGCVPGRLTLGTVDDLLLHELSHAIGFQSIAWHKPGPAEYTGHCAAALAGGRPLNAGLCQHEIEAIYASYGLRSTAPDLSKHVMTGLAGLGSLTLNVGATGTLTVTGLRFNRVNGSFCGQPDTTVCEAATASPTEATLSWSSSNTSVASLSGSGASRTVTGNSGGSATVSVGATAAAYEKAAAFGDPGTGTTAAVTVVVVPPAGPPTSLSASNITATSALVSWTNGDASAGTTTVVQYRMTGQSAWINASGSPAPAGQSSLTLSGLHCATSYDVNVYHVKSGVSSAWLTLTLFTTAACQVSGAIVAPSGFSQSSCTASTTGGKNYATYTLGWTAGSNPGGSIYQIGTALTNSSGSAAVIRTGGIIRTSDDVGPYLVTSTASPRYFWVRHVNGAEASAWVALAGNPIQIKDGCLL